MASLIRIINRLLPFATPGTPLVQDLVHLAVLCVLLYLAPQIQQLLKSYRSRGETQEPADRATQAGQGNDVEQLPDVAVVGDAANAPRDVRDQLDPQNAFDGVGNDEPEPNFAHDEDQPGPAQVPNTAAHRNVGTKKAKSLARKDQRRAYNEFMRSQGDAQRARDAQGGDAREARIAAEKERRRLAEQELELRKAKEREAKKKREEFERREIAQKTELVLSIVKDELEARSMCNLFQVARLAGSDVDEEWIEKILKASGIVGKMRDSLTLITETGWIVRVNNEDMNAVYHLAIDNNLADDNGQIEYQELGPVLERVLES